MRTAASNHAPSPTEQTRLSTGIAGLDEVLEGGLIAGRAYLLTGPPGGGKTTLGWHFLCAGAERGESVVFFTFGESEQALRANAASCGFDTRDVNVCDLSPSSDMFANVQSYDIFSAAEVELEPTTAKIKDALTRYKPSRIFVDSMTHLRYLARDANEFRRQSLSFLRYLIESGACVLMTSESSKEASDDDLRFLSDGVIDLTTGDRVGTLRVTKFRGSAYRGGRHAFRLTENGAVLFPRLMPERHAQEFRAEILPWGVPGLDSLLHGGIERGTVTIVSGPSGVGKTTIAVQFMKEAASRGERSAIYTFDERFATLEHRCRGLNIPVEAMIANGTLAIVEIEALRFSADEFAQMVRNDVEEHGTRIVMLDSISGYRLSVPGDDMTERLHALCRYLQNVGVTVILINELQELAEFRVTEVGISYLADNVLYLRYVEQRTEGRAELGRAIGVLKKRLSDFEKTLCSFEMRHDGLAIGRPLHHLAGIVSAVPVSSLR